MLNGSPKKNSRKNVSHIKKTILKGVEALSSNDGLAIILFEGDTWAY